MSCACIFRFGVFSRRLVSGGGCLCPAAFWLGLALLRLPFPPGTGGCPVPRPFDAAFFLLRVCACRRVRSVRGVDDSVLSSWIVGSVWLLFLLRCLRLSRGRSVRGAGCSVPALRIVDAAGLFLRRPDFMLAREEAACLVASPFPRGWFCCACPFCRGLWTHGGSLGRTGWRGERFRVRPEWDADGDAPSCGGL